VFAWARVRIRAPGRSSDRHREIVERAGDVARIGYAEGAGRARKCVGRERRVVGDRVGKDDRVRLGVREIERAAERVAELVVQTHADRSEDAAGEPRAVACLRAGREIGRVADDLRKRVRERRDALGRHRLPPEVVRALRPQNDPTGSGS
jgi:hypothetical protein